MLVVAVKDAPVSTGSARESAEPLFLSLPETARDLFTSTTQPAPVMTGSVRESAELSFFRFAKPPESNSCGCST
jgi:hypothetical protein